MNITKDLIEFAFGSALFINALLFIPQAIKIFKTKSTKGVSFITFFGFLLIQLAVVLHGVIHQDYVLVVGYLVSMITCGAVVALILTYGKRHRFIQGAELELEEVLAQIPGHIYWKNREGVCLGSNTNNWKDFEDKSLSEFIGKTDYDLFPKEEADKLRHADQEVMRTRKLTILEEASTTIDGELRSYISHKAPLRNTRNEVLGIVGMSLDITENKKNEQALVLAKEVAEAANRAKTEFLYGLQHDLKTPCSGILGIAEVLENSEQDLEKKENLSHIKHASKSMLDQLNQIFEFVHFENGQLPILKKQFSLYQLVSDTTQMMTPAAKHKALTLKTSHDNNIPEYMVGDQMRIQRILMNLIANGIKFTSHGHVNLETKLISKNDEKVVVKFTVEDTGVGMPEDKQNLIFQEFDSQTASHSDRYPGKGLGLRIVKQFLDDIGGELQLHSQVGKGSVFKILVPFKQSQLQGA